MDLHVGEPYWLMKNGLKHSFPTMTNDLKADVCVLGAGITGALAAHALTKEGVDVVVLDKRHPGMGSTCASTALLQYEIDEPLHSLIRMTGQVRAEQSYLACYRAIDAIHALVESEGLTVSFTATPSLQYASRKKHAKRLRLEYNARRRIGLDVELLSERETKDIYGFSAYASLWSGKGAQIDAYQLTHALLKSDPSLRVFDTSDVVDIHESRHGVRLKTKQGYSVRANHLVIACGYESQKFLGRPALELSSTYALIGKPVESALLWPDRTLLWETKTPYLYCRTTKDNRIIVGGRDDAQFNRKRRNSSFPKKAEKLADDFRILFPDIPLHIDFIWAGAFSGTADSLPYVGRAGDGKRVHYILGFGGNGIVFSQTGSEIVRDEILGRKNHLADLYSFAR